MNIKQPKIILMLVSSVFLTLGISVSFQSLLAAWTAPLANPAACLTGNPGCDAPISSGSPLMQQMQGALWIIDSAYPTNPHGLIVEKGNVGIGTIGPGAKLSVHLNEANVNTVPYINMYNDASGYADWSIKKIGSNDLTMYNAYSDAPVMTWQYVAGGGNVGIGTAGPGELLHVNGTGVARIRISAGNTSSNANLTFYQTTTQKGTVGYDNASDVMSFVYGTGLDNLTGIKINSSGNVGIGTTGPSQKLEVVNGNQAIGFTSGTNTSGYRLDIGVNDDGVNFANNSSSRGYNFKNANGTLVTVQSTGNVGIGTASPAQKLHVAGNARANRIMLGSNNTAGVAGDYYSIYRETGSWAFPFPDLVIQYHTGIKYDAYQGYGGHRFYTGHDGTGNPVGLRMQISDKVYVTGDLNVSGTAFANGQALCQANGTNCPAQTGIPYSGPGRPVSGWMVDALRNGAGGPYIYMSHSGGYGMHINTYNQSAGIYALELHNNAKQLLGVYNDGVVGLNDNALYVASTGNVGIGTTNPSQRLHVAGNLNVSGTAFANGQALCQANGTNCPVSSTNADTVDGLHADSFRQFYKWQNNHFSGLDGVEYATAFYDANDGGYYVNPAGTSKLNSIQTTGRYYSDEWIQMNNHSGLYSPLNGAHFYPNNGSYGSWRINGNRNGWRGLEFDSPGGNLSLMMNHDSYGWGNQYTGVHNNSYGWLWYFVHGNLYADMMYDKQDANYYVNPAGTSRMKEIQADRVYGFDDIRSPIFYDYNDTNYYVDPAGTSKFASLQSNTIYDRNDTAYYMDLNNTTNMKYLNADKMYDRNDANYYVDPAGTSKMKIIQADKVYGFNDIRSPIFYDYNNTNYYVDPAGTSKMKEINIKIHTKTNCSWISESASASGGCPDGKVMMGMSQACGEGGCGGSYGAYCCDITLGP